MSIRDGAAPTWHTAPVTAEDRRSAPGTCVNRFAIFAECPHCGGPLAPEHAHYRCGSCGWRDSCCD